MLPVDRWLSERANRGLGNDTSPRFARDDTFSTMTSNPEGATAADAAGSPNCTETKSDQVAIPALQVEASTVEVPVGEQAAVDVLGLDAYVHIIQPGQPRDRSPDC